MNGLLCEVQEVWSQKRIWFMITSPFFMCLLLRSWNIISMTWTTDIFVYYSRHDVHNGLKKDIIFQAFKIQRSLSKIMCINFLFICCHPDICIQWGLGNWTGLDFEWLKVDRMLNRSDLEWHYKTEQPNHFKSTK